jgi:hypothetical protein
VSDARTVRPPPAPAGATPPTTATGGPERPPLRLLGFAAGAVAVSAGLLLVSGRLVDLVGYLLATVVTVLLVAAFRSLDGRRRSKPSYVVPVLAQRIPPAIVSWVLLGAGIAIGGLHVWSFAESVARA